MGLFHGKMSFNNVQNKCVDAVVDGMSKKVWLSRSLAVVGVILINNKILMVKRGPGCPDEIGKWVLPCGYLDENETLKEAMYRETYEETGINLIEVREYADKIGWHCLMNEDDSFNSPEGMPIYVRSNPNMDKKQNVSAYMLMEINHYGMPRPEYNPDVCDPAETADVAWFGFDELHTMRHNDEIGFNHFESLKKIMGF